MEKIILDSGMNADAGEIRPYKSTAEQVFSALCEKYKEKKEIEIVYCCKVGHTPDCFIIRQKGQTLGIIAMTKKQTINDLIAKY